MLFESIKGYGDIAINNANIVYIVTFCFVITIVGLVFFLFLDKVKKSSQTTKIILSGLYSLTILYVLYYSINPIIAIEEKKDSRIELSLNTYSLYETNDDYLLVDKENGAVFKTTKENYVKYKACNKPKLYLYEYVLVYKNHFYGYGAVNSTMEIRCIK